MNKKILIVDDSAISRKMLKAILKEEYEIIEAENGKEAILLMYKEYKTLSAVLLDIGMPIMDGFQLLKLRRDNPIIACIPTIIISANDDEMTMEKAEEMGANAYLIKPFDPKEVQRVLEKQIKLSESDCRVPSSTDRLTKVLSRSVFFARVDIMVHDNEPEYYILSCINIDGFKIINDQYGTGMGDKVLRHIASSINNSAARVGGICCRITADYFAVLLPKKYAETREIYQTHEEAANPKFLNRKIRIRIGRYLIDDLSVSINSMYDRAKLACDSIRGIYEIYIKDYNDAMRSDMLYEQQIVDCMDDALKKEQFKIWLQPQYNHATGAMIGAEALVRWEKDGEVISPAKFIPIFEKNGFIYEMDKYIWEQACILLRRQLDSGYSPLPISVNISRRDIFHKHFIKTITDIIKKYNLPNDIIRLEVTESAFSDSTNVIVEKVNELIEMGFTVEIDDFGSGYSSLNTLKDVPASILKLDMRFFENTEDNQRGGNIVESVVRMAKWLGMAVVAEGVEEREQADFLKSIGCYYIQGYFYAKPMTIADYEALMLENEKESKMSRLQTVENLDNNEFWNAKSMDTLIFNSYVGAACILEVSGSSIEMIRANDSFVKALASTRLNTKDILALSWTKFMDKRSICMFKNAVKSSIENKQTVTSEYKFYNLPGCTEIVYFRTTLRVIATTGDRMLIYCLNENITAQKKAEESALEATERITAVLDNSQCGIIATIIKSESEAEYLFVNNRFYSMLGYTKEQFEKEIKSPFGCIFPEDTQKVSKAVTRLTKIGDSLTIKMRAIRRDKRMVWLRADIAVVKFANVKYPVQLSNFMDITEQTISEEKQAESAKQLEVIMSNINGGVSAIQISDDGSSKFVFNNEKYYELYGYTKEQAEEEKLDVMTLIHPDDIANVIQKVKKLKADGVPAIIDYRIKRRDGKMAYIRVNASLMQMHGFDNVITSVVTDITIQREIEDQLRAIIDNINGGVTATVIRNGKPKFVVANDKFFSILGYTKEQYEAECNDKYSGIHPDDRERIINQFETSDGGKKQYTMNYRIIRRDGEIRYIQNNISVINIFGVEEPVQLSVANDITEQRVAEIKEHNLSNQLNTIMSNIQGGITATAFHNKNDVEIIFSNDAFYEMYGYTKEQMQAEMPNVLDMIVDEDREKTMETVAQIVKTKGSKTYEYRCHKRDGSMVWIKCTNSVISIDGYGDNILLAVTEDVTKLRQMEMEKDIAIDRLQTVMNSMSNGMTAVAIHGNRTEFLFANDKYYEMHGITKEKYHQTYLADSLMLVHPDDRKLLCNMVITAEKTGEQEKAEYRILRPDGSIKWTKAVINITKLIGVDVPVQVTIFTDITAEKEASDQLNFLNDSAHDILVQSDAERAIDKTLENLLEYFDGERAYVIELDYINKVSNNTYERCIKGVSKQIDNLKNIPFNMSESWFAELKQNKYVIIEDVEAIDENNEAELKKMLKNQNIHSLILTPLWKNGGLVGFAGIDNAKKAINQLNRLGALADYISLLILRRDMNTKILRDAAEMKALINDTPGGIVSFRCKPNDIRIAYYNDGLCELTGYSRKEHAEKHITVIDLVFEEDRDIIKEKLKSLLKKQIPIECIFRINTNGGGYKWLNCKAVPLERINDELVVNAVLTDITAQQKEKENLRISEEFNRLAIEHSGNIITRLDVKTRTLTMPKNLNPIYGVPHILYNMPEEQIALGRVSADTADSYTKLFNDIYAGSKNGSAVFKQNSTKGWRWLEAKYTTVFSDSNKPVFAVITFSDITDNLEKEVIYNKWQQALSERGNETYTLYRCNLNKDSSYDTVEGSLVPFDVDKSTSTSFNDVTKIFTDKLVCKEDRESYIEFVDSNKMLASYYRGKRAASIEFRGKLKGGEERWLKLSVELVEYPNSTDVQAYLLFEDINESKLEELNIIEKAETDPLTGILNRAAFRKRLNEIIEHYGNSATHALLMIDIDDFKLVNDTFGHGIGDRTLIDISKLLSGTVRKNDLVGRLGGDEFLVFLTDIPSKAVAEKKAEEICKLTSKYFDKDIKISGSIGVAVFPRDGKNFDMLYEKADKCLYRAKKQGKNRFSIGDEDSE